MGGKWYYLMAILGLVLALVGYFWLSRRSGDSSKGSINAKPSRAPNALLRDETIGRLEGTPARVGNEGQKPIERTTAPKVVEIAQHQQTPPVDAHVEAKSTESNEISIGIEVKNLSDGEQIALDSKIAPGVMVGVEKTETVIDDTENASKERNEKQEPLAVDQKEPSRLEPGVAAGDLLPPTRDGSSAADETTIEQKILPVVSEITVDDLLPSSHDRTGTPDETTIEQQIGPAVSESTVDDLLLPTHDGSGAPDEATTEQQNFVEEKENLEASIGVVAEGSEEVVPVPAIQLPSEQTTSQATSEPATTNETDVGSPRKLGTYRPPSEKPPKPRISDRPSSEKSTTQQPLELRVNAQLDHHGYCSFRILAQRPAGLPPEIDVQEGRGASTSLSECSEDWYEVDAKNKLSDWLAGVLFGERQTRGSGITWQLSGRDYHVLAAQPGFAGPTSTTRLTIGRKHLVLCRTSVAGDIEGLLAASGCGAMSSSREDMGAPEGWAFFWPAIPSKSLPAVAGDSFNVLRPQPELELVLEGGVRLRDSDWLAGYPPSIRMNGVASLEEPVYIDAKLAEVDATGTYSAAGRTDPGPHIVACAGKTRSYYIVEPELSWSQWDAHRFAQGAICGAWSTVNEKFLVTVPASNSVLLGAVPGEVFRCPKAAGREWSGFVPFEVVWALPDDPLHCDKRSSQILLLHQTDPRGSRRRSRRSRRGNSEEWDWSQAIRDCRRKGLALASVKSEASALWRAYGVVARDIWKTLK